MKPGIFLREQMLQNIVAWGAARADIQALALVGSGARVERPADEWSDIDLVLLTTQAAEYLKTSEWAGAIGEVCIDTLERDGAGQVVERRVLYQNGIDVDFIVLSADGLQAFQQEPLASITRRGLRVLLDKPGMLAALRIERGAAAPAAPPTPGQFSELVNDFWFHAVWTAKKIRRGELWTAKSCCDGYMKGLLLTMITWHAAALEGGQKETWYNGRFIEQWAPAYVVERLPEIYAHYAEADLWRALLSTMDLFAAIGARTARQFAYAYPDNKIEPITRWVKDMSVTSRIRP